MVQKRIAGPATGLTIMLLVSLLTLMVGLAVAETPKEFFQGKRVDYTIPSRPGGTVDRYGRLFAAEFQKQLGATFVVTNRRGGSGGMEGFMHIYNSRGDGLHLGDGISSVLWLNEITQAAGAKYKMDKFSYIYGVGWEPVVLLVAPDGPYNSIDGLRAGKNLKFGVSSPRGNFALGALTVCYALNLDAKVIPGMKGSGAAALSVKQGESAGLVCPLASALRQSKSVGLKPLFVVAGDRTPQLPGVPAFTELVSLKGKAKFLVEEVFGKSVRTIWTQIGPPGIPKDRLDYLRESAKSMAQKPEFLSKLTKTIGYKPKPEEFFPGDEVRKVAERTAARTPEIRSAFAEMIALYMK